MTKEEVLSATPTRTRLVGTVAAAVRLRLPLVPLPGQRPARRLPAAERRAVASVSVVRIRPGQVITIPEEHYLYGTGPLTLRVTEVDEHPPPGVEWLTVRGVEQRWNGDGDEREVMVRIAAFPKIGSG